MKVNGLTIILLEGEEITIKVLKEEVTPLITTDNMLGFTDLLDIFNLVLLNTGHNPVVLGQLVYNYMNLEYEFAKKEWEDPNSAFFSSLPEVYNYNGNNKDYLSIAYNAMQAWLMASLLVEYVPTYGAYTNTLTELFKVAYRIDSANTVPIYADLDLRSDVNKVREIAAYICSYCHSKYTDLDIITFRSELNGLMIPASNWDELLYKNTVLTDSQGRYGYRVDNLGYLVNTLIFMPNSPGPKVPGTIVCEVPLPYEEGEPKELFNLSTGNYKVDEAINDYIIDNWNMMAQTSLSEWNSYSLEKRLRLINAAATIPCTTMYMFGTPKKVNQVLKDKKLPIVDGYPRYVFKEASNGIYTIDGPFSDLAGIYRYNVSNKNPIENFIDNVLCIADNSRFPTQDPNYGRCRPGCKATRLGGEKNPIHGSKENELYNISISAIVADDEALKQKALQEDGWAADSPRSYVSGHSTLVVTMALLLSLLNPTKTINYMKKAHEYSVNRSIARFHWNSDCILGRLFGTMIAPILRAMSGLLSGFKQTYNWIHNIQNDWNVNLIIKNTTGIPIQSTGEIRLYINDHIGVNTYLPGAVSNAGALYTFNNGETNFSNIPCIMNGDSYMDDSYNGATINEVRFYDYKHWNNIDAGFNAVLDTSDSRCSKVLTSGAIYVIKITKI